MFHRQMLRAKTNSAKGHTQARHMHMPVAMHLHMRRL